MSQLHQHMHISWHIHFALPGKTFGLLWARPGFFLCFGRLCSILSTCCFSLYLSLSLSHSHTYTYTQAWCPMSQSCVSRGGFQVLCSCAGNTTHNILVEYIFSYICKSLLVRASPIFELSLFFSSDFPRFIPNFFIVI